MSLLLKAFDPVKIESNIYLHFFFYNINAEHVYKRGCNQFTGFGTKLFTCYLLCNKVCVHVSQSRQND